MAICISLFVVMVRCIPILQVKFFGYLKNVLEAELITALSFLSEITGAGTLVVEPSVPY